MTTPYATASLYVGDLATEITEATLFELFNQVGPVASIRVCRDTVTRRSLGYAYVNFHNVVDAERALDTLNYTAIKGRPCRIMWSHRDPSIRKSGVGNIFIKSLDKTIDNKALYDTFSAFGNILSCKVATDEAGNSRGYGFVHFETSQAAETAIVKVNGMLLNGKMVYVGPFQKRGERSTNGMFEQKFTNVYLKNLDEELKEDDLLSIFQRFGTITSCMIQRDETGKSRGFGFLNFDNPDSAKQAVDEMNGAPVGSKQIYVGRAQKKSEREEELRRRFEQLKMEKLMKYQGLNVYVKNLDDTVDDQKLSEDFAQFGEITSAKVMRDDKGISKGFGFVCFATADEAQKAVETMNGRMVSGKPVYCAIAQRKEVRRAQLEQAYNASRALPVQRGLAPVGVAPVGPGLPPPAGPAPMYPPGPMYYQPAAAGYPPAQRQPGMVYPPQQMIRPRVAGPPQYQPTGRGAPGQYPAVPGAYPPVQVPQQRRQGPPLQRPARVGPGAPAPIPGQGPLDKGVSAGRGQMPNGIAGPGIPGQGRGARGMRYVQNVRNRPDAQAMPGVILPPGMLPPNPILPGMAVPAAAEPLTASALAAATPEQQKQMLGERLFPLIADRQPELAGKITGMLLEMDNGELLHLLESPDALAAKILEAITVLQSHGAIVDQSAPGPVAGEPVATAEVEATA
mmetsp:Transcript_23229/g.39930  ORF Transcript_23229/g.39930 Transcript_23229/m.39930 type:complete len:680 (-) Transcript_23229:251-2290(-)